MDYVLRRVTDGDKQFFINSGVKSPFGGRPGFGRYMVESLEDNAKMVFIGGQGIMKEDGTEWSDMAHYCAVVWKGKSYIVEFYTHKKWFEEEKRKNQFESMYKITSVSSLECTDEEKKIFIEIVKKCFITYDLNRYQTSVCEKVIFMDTEVRWV